MAGKPPPLLASETAMGRETASDEIGLGHFVVSPKRGRAWAIVQPRGDRTRRWRGRWVGGKHGMLTLQHAKHEDPVSSA